jgi:hypothetical protein
MELKTFPVIRIQKDRAYDSDLFTNELQNNCYQSSIEEYQRVI